MKPELVLGKTQNCMIAFARLISNCVTAPKTAAIVMYFDDSQLPDFSQQFRDDDEAELVGDAHADEETGKADPEPFPCSRGHRSSLNLRTTQGGAICLVCLANLLTASPRPPTLHVSFAVSQLSQALSQPPFAKSLLTFHSHFLTSPLVHALASFDDEPIARQIIDLVGNLCGHGGRGQALAGEFVARISAVLSSRALAWSRRQLFTLNCLGALLNCQPNDCSTSIKCPDALVSNLVMGLQLPSEDIRGEILFVLYKLSLHLYASKEGVGTDPFVSHCPKVLYLSLDALLKTQSDDVRLNCIAFLTVLTQRGFLRSSYANGLSILDYGADNSVDTPNFADGSHLYTLFAEAIKGSLLSPDEQVQIGVLDLIFYDLSCEQNQEKKIQLLLESNVGDYVFEILRLAGCRDPVVNSCLRVLDILSTAEQDFKQTLALGFATLIPVIQCIAEVPYHPCQSQILKLIWNCISNFLGVATISQCEELVLILTKMLRRHGEGEFGMLPETYTIICSIFVSMIKSPYYRDLANLIICVQEASKFAILSSLTISGMNSNQILQSLYLLKEAYAYGREDHSLNNFKKRELRKCIIDVCKLHILPWLVTAINERDDEEVVLGVLETFDFILCQESDSQAREFAETLISCNWFSLSFESLGLFPTERMKLRVYLMISSLVDILFGNDSGQTIMEAVSYLPTDPNDLLFLLGQTSSHDAVLSSCQSATILILYCSCLHDERLADDKLVLASLEQYILVNGCSLRRRSAESFTIFQLVNLYGLYRGLAKSSYQISYSPEAERIFIHLLTEYEWDLPCAPIHLTSLKWLFQQEKICSSLSQQIFKFFRIYSLDGTPAVTCGKGQALDVQVIAQLVGSGDNYAAKAFVCLVEELVKEKNQESDLFLLLNLVECVIQIVPSTSDQLCLNGIAKAIQILYYDSRATFSPEVYTDSLIFIFNLLSSVHSESLTDNDAWVTVTTKLMDQLICRGPGGSFNHEEVLILGILCLILHHSTNGALMGASKAILLNTPLASMLGSIIDKACSGGPTMIDNDEGTSSGSALLHVILLLYFFIRSVHAVLPGIVDWSSFLHQSSTTLILPLLGSHCQELCTLIHYGCPLVKVAASYCLLESFTRLSDQRRTQHKDLQCKNKYLKSVMAVLEGLLFYGDNRVAVNCGLCLSIIFEWEVVKIVDRKVIEKNKWCRLVVEELAMSLAVPSLASKSCSNNGKASIYIATALLKLEKVPGWMKSVFDDACITSILQNLSGSSLSTELILLFRELLNAGFLNAEHIVCVNRVFQECRKLMYREDVEGDHEDVRTGKAAAIKDDASRVTDHLFHVISYDSRISRGHATGNERLLEEIEMFFRASAEEGDG